MLKKIMRLALTPLLVMALTLSGVGMAFARLKKDYPIFKFEKSWMKLTTVIRSEKSLVRRMRIL